jgi:hypothetical protein
VFDVRTFFLSLLGFAEVDGLGSWDVSLEPLSFSMPVCHGRGTVSSNTAVT